MVYRKSREKLFLCVTLFMRDRKIAYDQGIILQDTRPDILPLFTISNEIQEHQSVLDWGGEEN